jgi:VWFA-related protein
MSRTVVLLFVLFASLAVGVTSQTVSERETQTIYVTVKNSDGEFVTGLKSEYLRLYENNLEQKIISFSPSSEPMSIGFLCDISDSTYKNFGENVIRRVATSIYEVSKQQKPSNEYFLIGFARDVVPLQDWTANVEDLKPALGSLISVRANKSRTSSVYDAFYDAIDKLSSGKYGKKVLIAFTDAKDTSSKRPPDDVIQLLKKKNVLIYVVILNGFRSSLEEFKAGEFIDSLTETSGGSVFGDGFWLYSKRKRDISDMTEIPFLFEHIFEELSNQYSLSFTPTGYNKGKSTSIDLKFDLPSSEKKRLGYVSLRYRRKFNYY